MLNIKVRTVYRDLCDSDYSHFSDNFSSVG